MARADLLLLALPLLTGGCALGRNDLDGSVVIGFKAGQLVETTNQALAAGLGGAGHLLGGPWGELLTLGGLGFAAHARGRDRGWDEHKTDTTKES